MITLFTTTRPFSGIFDHIQRNAIRSWMHAFQGCEILIFGNAEGSFEISKEYGLIHIPEIELHPGINGALLSSLFQKAEQRAAFRVLCHINCDIIMPGETGICVKMALNRMKKFVMTGRRYEIRVDHLIDPGRFQSDAYLEDLEISHAKRFGAHYMDYFIYTKGALGGILPFIVGGGRYDSWLVERALCLGIPLIDATEAIHAIHQSHDDPDSVVLKYTASSQAANFKINDSLWSKCDQGIGFRPTTIDFANYYVTKKGIKIKRNLWVWRVHLTFFLVYHFRFTRLLLRFITKLLCFKRSLTRVDRSSAGDIE